VVLHPAALQRYTETDDGLSKTTRLPQMTAAHSPKTSGSLFTALPCTQNLLAKASKSRLRANLLLSLAEPHFPPHGILESPTRWAAAIVRP
jgi:hypothetical protein